MLDALDFREVLAIYDCQATPVKNRLAIFAMGLIGMSPSAYHTTALMCAALAKITIAAGDLR